MNLPLLMFVTSFPGFACFPSGVARPSTCINGGGDSGIEYSGPIATGYRLWSDNAQSSNGFPRARRHPLRGR